MVGPKSSKAIIPKPVKSGAPRRRPRSVAKSTLKYKFIYSDTASYYKYNPFRKWVELQVYNIYLLNKGLKQVDMGAVAVTKNMLKRVIQNKQDVLLILQNISSQISRVLSPDQKVLVWDYLKHAGLPKEINLAYSGLNDHVITLLRSNIQRRGIECGICAGLSPEHIYRLICKDNPRYKYLTIEDIEIYRYFFWNLSEGSSSNVSRTDVGLKIDELRENIERGTNYKEAHKNDPVPIDRKLSDEIDNCQYKYFSNIGFYQRRVSNMDLRMVATPYYLSEHADVYTMWTKISGGLDLVEPMESYKIQKNMLSGIIRESDIVIARGKLDPEHFDETEGVQEMIRVSIMMGLEKMYEGNDYETHLYLKGVAHEVSRIARNYNIEPSKPTSVGKARTERIITKTQFEDHIEDQKKDISKQLASKNE
ncbi:MAG: hypothetical protein WCY30_00165 [Candidatus Neomarinimicrobiota bacterium]|jgi:hypothetical protein